MKRFIIVMLALAIVSPALAEDRMPAPWRGAEGSTWAIWEFEVDPGELGYIEPDGGYFGDTDPHFDPGAIIYDMAPEGVVACVGGAEGGGWVSIQQRRHHHHRRRVVGPPEQLA